MRWWFWLCAVAVTFVALTWQPMPPLALKNVLVCGASTGIGEHIARRYAQEGARLVLVSRREAELQRVADDCRALGAAEVHVAAVDLSTQEGCEEAIRIAISHLGQLDTLILNHIIGFFKNLLDVPPEERYSLYEKIFRVNAFSYFHLTMTALPYLNQTNGRIGVVSSLAGKAGPPMVAPYAATKHSLHGFFDSLRQDLHGRTNVTITTHVLGNIDTPNAVANTKGHLTRIARYPPTEAANCIVEGTERGLRETFYPWAEVYFFTILHPIIPGVLDALVRLFID